MGASPQIRGHRGTESAVKRASELARRQFGAIARRQLLACGFGADRVKSWVRSGRLHPRYPGVFAYGRRELGTEGELAAALLLAGPGAALGGLSALWWMRLLGSPPRKIHVDAPRRCSPRRGLVFREVREENRVWLRSLPVAPLPQALLACRAAPHPRHPPPGPRPRRVPRAARPPGPARRSGPRTLRQLRRPQGHGSPPARSSPPAPAHSRSTSSSCANAMGSSCPSPIPASAGTAPTCSGGATT